MYDKVVGNSYVPDMIRSIGASFKELDNVMVKPVMEGTSKVNAQFFALSENQLKNISAQTELGKSVEEIAKKMGLYEGTVRSVVGALKEAAAEHEAYLERALANDAAITAMLQEASMQEAAIMNENFARKQSNDAAVRQMLQDRWVWENEQHLSKTKIQEEIDEDYRKYQNEVGIRMMEDEAEQLALRESNWRETFQELTTGFEQLANIGGKSLGSIFTGVGSVIGAVNAADKGVSAWKSGFNQFTSGQGLMSVLGGLGQMAGGIGTIVAAAQVAIQTIRALWDAFKSEESKVVNKPRDKFFEQYGGYEGLAQKLTAASNGDTAERLIRDLYDADTAEKFKNAQRPIVELIGGNTFAQGTPNLDFVDFTPRGQLALLHNEEAVVPRGREAEFAQKHGVDGNSETIRLLMAQLDSVQRTQKDLPRAIALSISDELTIRRARA
jgi:hypothetical protein